MSQFNDTGYGTVALTEAVGLHLRVNAAGELCGIAERGIGHCQVVGAVGDIVSVALHSKAGTVKVVAAAAISKDAAVFSAAGGKASVSASTAYQIGIAMEASAANNDIIEIMPTLGTVAVT